MSRGLTLRRLEQASAVPYERLNELESGGGAVEEGTIEELAEELADALGAEPSERVLQTANWETAVPFTPLLSPAYAASGGSLRRRSWLQLPRGDARSPCSDDEPGSTKRTCAPPPTSGAGP